jgi:glycosyltransferase involved in cell wall biosynthesis
MKTVAVVTATTGRHSLYQTMRSVHNQTHPCQHYVVFDGVVARKHFQIPDSVHTIELPVATGKNGIMNGGICAAAAFLVTEDYICFLDDDNWFDPDHIQTMMDVIGDKAYCYSLRKLYDGDTFFANDDGESLGHHGQMVDVNCFLFKREVCCGIAPLWYHTNGKLMVGDRMVWQALKDNNTPWAATGRYTVNYRMGANFATKGFFFLHNALARSKYPDQDYPWSISSRT